MQCPTSLVCGVVAVSLLFTLAAGQNETIEATLTAKDLYSPGYANGAYESNVTYDYLVYTNITNHTVLATLRDCELENSQIKDIFNCHDYFIVYDGNSTASTNLGKFCCRTATLPTYQSTGDTLYIVFESDSSTVFKGFSMTIQSDGPTTSTSSTSTSTQTSTTTAQAQPSTDDKSKNYTWVIVGCVIGGVNLIIIIVIIVVCFVKKPDRAKTPGSSHVTNRILWSRSNTTVEPISIKEVPPGEVVQTNIFDMDLPSAEGKANRLPPFPPLSHSLGRGEKEDSLVLQKNLDMDLPSAEGKANQLPPLPALSHSLRAGEKENGLVLQNNLDDGKCENNSDTKDEEIEDCSTPIS